MTRSLRELTACSLVAAGLGAGTASAQNTTAPLTLAGAIDMALSNYPALA